MFRASHRPSSGAQNCNCSLWFYIRLWLPVAAMAQPSQQPATINVCKTRGCNYIFELLMMGGVTPETCWAIKKHCNNKFYYTVAFFFRIFVMTASRKFRSPKYVVTFLNKNNVVVFDGILKIFFVKTSRLIQQEEKSLPVLCLITFTGERAIPWLWQILCSISKFYRSITCFFNIQLGWTNSNHRNMTV